MSAPCGCAEGARGRRVSGRENAESLQQCDVGIGERAVTFVDDDQAKAVAEPRRVARERLDRRNNDRTRAVIGVRLGRSATENSDVVSRDPDALERRAGLLEQRVAIDNEENSALDGLLRERRGDDGLAAARRQIREHGSGAGAVPSLLNVCDHRRLVVTEPRAGRLVRHDRKPGEQSFNRIYIARRGAFRARHCKSRRCGAVGSVWRSSKHASASWAL